MILAVKDTRPCRHPESLWGRCADCGMTWSAQVKEWDQMVWEQSVSMIHRNETPVPSTSNAESGSPSR